MKGKNRHFSSIHLYIFLGFYLVFGALTLAALWGQSASDWRENLNVAATIGCVSGPFTGAIARQFQDCCVAFSLGLFPFSAAILLIGIMLQFVPLPIGFMEKPVRLGAWCLGLFGWFGGGIVSFAHALS